GGPPPLSPRPPPGPAEPRRQSLVEALHPPGLLRQLAAGAGLADRLPELEALAAEDLRRALADPTRHGSLVEQGLAALCEAVAFDYLRSRIADRVAAALPAHRGLSPRALARLTAPPRGGPRPADRGLAEIAAYVRFHGIDPEDARAIVEAALRENLFVERYLGRRAAAPVRAGRPRGSSRGPAAGCPPTDPARRGGGWHAGTAPQATGRPAARAPRPRH